MAAVACCCLLWPAAVFCRLGVFGVFAELPRLAVACCRLGVFGVFTIYLQASAKYATAQGKALKAKTGFIFKEQSGLTCNFTA